MNALNPNQGGKAVLNVKTLLIMFSALLFSLYFGGSAVAEQVTITYARWGPPALVDLEEQLIARFMEENPDIRVETILRTSHEEQFERVVVESAAGVAPDVVMGTEARSWIMGGIIRPLDDFLATESQDYVGSLQHTTLAEWQYEVADGYLIRERGNYWAVPYNDFVTVLVYNQELFDEAGLAYPDAGDWTYETLTQAARHLTRDVSGDGTPDIWGLSWNMGSTGMRGLVMAHGAQWAPLVHEPTLDTVVDSAEFRRALELVRSWIWDFRVQSPQRQRMRRGNVGIETLHNDSILPMIQEIGDQFRWNIAHMPEGPAGRFTRVFTQPLAITTGSQHPEAAWRFIRFMTGETAAVVRGSTGSSLPSHRAGAMAFLEQQPFSAMTMLDAFGYGSAGPPVSLPLDVDLAAHLDPVFAGQESVEIATTRLARLYRNAIAEFLDR